MNNEADIKRQCKKSHKAPSFVAQPPRSMLIHPELWSKACNTENVTHPPQGLSSAQKWWPRIFSLFSTRPRTPAMPTSPLHLESLQHQDGLDVFQVPLSSLAIPSTWRGSPVPILEGSKWQIKKEVPSATSNMFISVRWSQRWLSEATGMKQHGRKQKDTRTHRKWEKCRTRALSSPGESNYNGSVGWNFL